MNSTLHKAFKLIINEDLKDKHCFCPLSKRGLWFLWAGSTGSSAAPVSRHWQHREPGATRCGCCFLFSAFNFVGNGVSLFVKCSATFSRHFKRGNVAIGKKSAATNVFKYYKRRSKHQSDNKLLCIFMVLYL